MKNPEYLAYVYSLDNNIVNTKNTIGIAIRLNEMIYYLPIDSANDSDYDENIIWGKQHQLFCACLIWKHKSI